MSTGKIQVYYGAGRGKTSAALGYAIHEPLNRKPMYARYFMDAEIMSALINVLTAERQDAVKFVTTINRDSVKNLLSLHMHVTAVQRKRTA